MHYIHILVKMPWTLGSVNVGDGLHHSPRHVEHPTVEGCVFTVICRDRRQQTICSQKAFTTMTSPYPTRFAMSLDAVEVTYVVAIFANKPIQGWWSGWTDWTPSGNPRSWGVSANAAPKRRKWLRGRKGTSNYQVGAGSRLLSGRENKKFLGRIKLLYQEKKMRWMDVFLTVLFGDGFFHQQIGWAEGVRQVWMLQVDEFATLDLTFERQWARFFAKDGRAQLLNLPSLRPSTLGTEEGVFDSWRVDGFSVPEAVSSFLKLSWELGTRRCVKTLCKHALRSGAFGGTQQRGCGTRSGRQT